jgi:hypothetical protein
MRIPTFATLLAVAVAAAAVAAPQSLGEVAAREKARRDKDKRPTAKVITEDELRGRRGSGTVSQPAAEQVATAAAEPQAGAATPAAGTTGAPAAAPQKTEDELRAERQAEWRQKVQEAQSTVTNLRARQEQIQAELNDVRMIYGPNRSSLVQAEQGLTNIQEEGRRNGYR